MSMPRYLYISANGEQKPVCLSERSARSIALMVNATVTRAPGRARAAEIAGLIPWIPPSGLLATHALALSTVSVVTQLLTAGGAVSSQSMDLPLLAELGAELGTLWVALDNASLSAFEEVALEHVLPAPVGACASAHAAVRAVLADARARVEPILLELGLLGPAQPVEVVLDDLRARGEPQLEAALARFAKEYRQSLVKRWSGWFTIEQTLVGEVAGAAQVGLIRAENGEQLSEERFSAAIEALLAMQRQDSHEHLFSRWRDIAPLVRAIRVRADGRVPTLVNHRIAIEALGNLTTDVLSYAAAVPFEAPGLLDLLQVLREMRELAHREAYLIERHEVPEFDRDLAAQVRALVTERLPPALTAASKEVDWLTLKPTAAASGLGASPVVGGNSAKAERHADFLEAPDRTRPGEAGAVHHSGDHASDGFDFKGTSEASVTAVVRALKQLRSVSPDTKPSQEQIKAKGNVLGGAGDRAVRWAIENRLITPDFLVTTAGDQFLKHRS